MVLVSYKPLKEYRPIKTIICRMVKKLEPGLTAEVTLQPSPRLWLACCSPHPAHSTPREGATGGGGETYELEDMEQSPQSTRQNVLPVKRINRSLLMPHEWLPIPPDLVVDRWPSYVEGSTILDFPFVHYA